MSVTVDRDIALADRSVPHAWDKVRRYCGLQWSGGPPETWAFRYYDTLGSLPTAVEATDVLAASVLHAGIGRAHLAFFHDTAPALNAWMTPLPVSTCLSDLDDEGVAHLVSLRDRAEEVPLALLTKVLHRKRPELIPLVDREVLNWYRPVTGARAATDAWPALLEALRTDLAANRDALARMSDDLEAKTGVRVSALRIIDIALWMGGAR